jgi:NitT/TauT family transport system permease protein
MIAIEWENRSRSLSLSVWLRSIAFILALLILWRIVISRHPDQLLPGPVAVIEAIGELLRRGLSLKYVVAPLFRVTWAFALAAILWFGGGDLAAIFLNLCGLLFPLLRTAMTAVKIFPPFK